MPRKRRDIVDMNTLSDTSHMAKESLVTLNAALDIYIIISAAYLNFEMPKKPYTKMFLDSE
jgi:hypothetical protein